MYLSAIVSEYTSLGCWKDTADRAIPTLEGKCNHLDGHYQTRINALQKCLSCAQEMGMNIFSLQDRGWCTGTVSDGKEYAKYGVALECPSNGLGAPGINNVYKFTGVSG